MKHSWQRGQKLFLTVSLRLAVFMSAGLIKGLHQSLRNRQHLRVPGMSDRASRMQATAQQDNVVSRFLARQSNESAERPVGLQRRLWKLAQYLRIGTARLLG
ncbi:MAG: hypothetical protein ACKO3T_27110, partial [Planctomycetaceae bacterium]